MCVTDQLVLSVSKAVARTWPCEVKIYFLTIPTVNKILLHTSCHSHTGAVEDQRVEVLASL